MDKLDKLLLSVAINPSLSGYKYLKKAIELCSSCEEYKYQTTKKLYPKIAELYNVNAYNVERNIRSAIEHSIDNMSSGSMKAYFSKFINKRSGSITNKTYIAVLTMLAQSEE